MMNKNILSQGFTFKLMMTKIITASAMTAFTVSTQAQVSVQTNNIKFAEKLVIQDLEKYASEYGIMDLYKIESLGVSQKKYNFKVDYSKKFCIETGDDERLTCSVYMCSSSASVNSDAIVEFEPEGSRKKCKQVPDSTTYESY